MPVAKITDPRGNILQRMMMARAVQERCDAAFEVLCGFTGVTLEDDVILREQMEAPIEVLKQVRRRYRELEVREAQALFGKDKS